MQLVHGDPALLKSDHFGIEIYHGRLVGQQWQQLKSDHFGIEIHVSDSCMLELMFTKIRPFWD